MLSMNQMYGWPPVFQEGRTNRVIVRRNIRAVAT
jgi:hypothetical protein